MRDSNNFLLLALSAALVACAGAPAPAPSPSPALAAPAGTPVAVAESTEGEPRWSGTTDAEVAAELDRRMEDAARGYVKLRKDGQMMFCKKYKVIGSNIKTLHCITEAELRNQVENMDDYRRRMRDASKCTHGVGCQS